MVNQLPIHITTNITWSKLIFHLVHLHNHIQVVETNIPGLRDSGPLVTHNFSMTQPGI